MKEVIIPKKELDARLIRENFRIPKTSDCVFTILCALLELFSVVEGKGITEMCRVAPMARTLK